MAKWFAALIIFFPLSVHQLDYRSRFTDGLTIKMKRSSPAYAALEDSSQTYSDHTDTKVIQEVAALSTGRVRIHNHIAAGSAAPKLLALKTMVLRQSFQARAPLQRDMDLRTETPGTGLLPLEERKRILAQYFRSQDWSAPTVREKAKELIQAELQGPTRADSEVRTVTVASSSTPIIVARPGTDISGLLKGVPHPLPSHNSIMMAVNTPPPTTPSVTTASAFRGGTAAMLANPHPKPDADATPTLTVSSLAPSQKNPHLIKGQLEIRDGLAFMGSETYFTLHRVSDGTVHEAGRVNITEASFEIYVHEPRGQLVAELRSRDGQTLGRGRLDLDSESPTDDLKIDLTPVTNGATVRVASAYTEGNHRVPVKNALVAFDQNGMPQGLNEDGLRQDPDRARSSTFMVRATADKHWPTLAMGTEGEIRDVRLYPESMMRSLLDLTMKEGRSAAEQAGVVWGRILKDGKPIRGVEVELAGSYMPVYFNQIYLPDNNLHATDDNGMFAFLLVRPGVQAVRVRYNGKMYPAQVFPTEQHHLSYVEINLEGNQSVNVALQDAFDPKQKMSAHVRFVGVDDEVGITGSQKLHYPAGPDMMMLEADAGSEYELSRVQVLKSDSRVIVPMIKRSWLQSIADIKQFELVPHRGIVVGYVVDQPFQVEFTGYTTETPQLAYFDAQGMLTAGNSGPAGGGFILYNAPLGLQTLSIKPIASNQVYTQAFVAEPEFVHTLKYSFGGSY